jgi:quercetin dioxygenase-like cupin family protein
MRRALLPFFPLLLLLPLAPASAQVQTLIQLPPAQIVLKDAPPTLPKGTKMAVLEGDPARPGIFTMRMVVPKGFRLPRHTHPQDERVTVLRGRLHVVIGEGDSARDVGFGPGGFYVTPAGVPHVVYAAEETELQITGFGPWEVRADPGAATPPAQRGR